MKRTFPANRSVCLRLALCAGAVALLTACASDSGEEVADAPFPKLADVPPRPEASTTPEERAELKKQLERRRDQVNQAAASLLRGGTEPVPVALESRVPAAPGSGEASSAPPPLPEGLPEPPEADRSLPDAETEAGSAPSADGEEAIRAPGEGDMPPAKAAGETEEQEQDEAEDDETNG